MNAGAKDTLKAVLVVLWSLVKIICSMVWALFTGLLDVAQEAKPVAAGRVDDDHFRDQASYWYRGPGSQNRR